MKTKALFLFRIIYLFMIIDWYDEKQRIIFFRFIDHIYMLGLTDMIIVNVSPDGDFTWCIDKDYRHYRNRDKLISTAIP